MKRYISILALLLASLLYPQSKIDINDLVEVDGKMYKPLSDKLYSGIVYDSYTGTGEKKLEGFYRNGLKNGEWAWWNVFGGIDSTGNFRKGLFYGQWKFYHSNGQLKAIGFYRNGDGTNRDEYGLTAHGRHGKWTFWYENGMQASEITYKEGEIVKWTSWNMQGQKEWKGTLNEYQAGLGWYKTFKVVSSSMENTLIPGNIYKGVPIKYDKDIKNSVVVFEYPRDRKVNYAFRVIAEPGDTLLIKDRKVFVNGKEFKLPEHGRFTLPMASSTIKDPNIFMGRGNKDNLAELVIPKKGDRISLGPETALLVMQETAVMNMNLL